MEVEKLSWPYLILNVICASIFTSYAFKIESVELALVNVFSLISNIFLLGVYLYINPNQSLIVQFFATIISCQVFNYDLMSSQACGALGILAVIMQQIVPLSQIPSMIETRSTAHLPKHIKYFILLEIVSTLSWMCWSFKSGHYLYIVALLTVLAGKSIQLLFYLWVKRIIVLGNSGPISFILKHLILYFKQYQVRKNFQEMENSFYTSSRKQAYLKQYQNYREETEQYQDDVAEILDQSEMYQ